MDKQLKQDSWVRGTAVGKGSYGTVSLATAAGSGAVFAVKSVDKSSCLPFQIEALENEIGILRSLSSPYVVGYLGDDETPSFRNLHMEYLPGGTVADVARARGVFGVEVEEEQRTVRNHAFCVASALEYLHAQGIVHCDVKGDNVLVGPTPGTAKLADFGSAMATAAAITRPLGGKRISPRGSPLWMAPEVIRGEYQGQESDVWSLGCTVIEMVTGKPAWEDRGAAQTICRIGYSDDLPPIPTELSELGRDFVEKCLRREIHQRWSCHQLLQHPFISKCSQAAPEFAPRASPRSVLDCFKLEYSDEEDEESGSDSKFSSDESELKCRIGKLSSGGGAIWESDGWTLVRRGNFVSVTEKEEAEAALSVSSDDDDVGTSWAYRTVGGAELENDADSFVIGESTSEEYFVDSSNCSSTVVETVRSDHRHHNNPENGVVTDPNNNPAGCGRVDPPHFIFLLFILYYYWVLILYHSNLFCCQLLYSTDYKKLSLVLLLFFIIYYYNRNNNNVVLISCG